MKVCSNRAPGVCSKRFVGSRPIGAERWHGKMRENLGGQQLSYTPQKQCHEDRPPNTTMGLLHRSPLWVKPCVSGTVSM